MKTEMAELIIDNENPIQIISGEGTLGTRELFKGKRTARAIKCRLTRERCGGDRWAYAQVYNPEYTYAYGPVGIDLETGELGDWHDC